MKNPVRTTLWAMALTPLVFLCERLRQLVEGSMPLHMLAQFPLLFLAGASLSRLVVLHWPALAPVWRRFDPSGLLGLVTISSVAALWMVPAALDAALMSADVAAWKFCSWWIAGAFVALAWPNTGRPLRLFLLGNLAWMLLTFGWMYIEAEQRLCVSYRFDEQVWTGWGLALAGSTLIAALIAMGSDSVGQFETTDCPNPARPLRP